MVQLMPLHPKTQSSLASFKSRLALPFWYWLTQVVLEKRPLNGCSVVVVVPTVISSARELSKTGDFTDSDRQRNKSLGNA